MPTSVCVLQSAASAVIVAQIATSLVHHCRSLTSEIDLLHAQITALATSHAPALLAIPGCGPLTAAKILGETAGISRFASASAYARHNGTAPIPVWSSGTTRHRLSRTGSRQLNAALHIIAVTRPACIPAPRHCSSAAAPGATAAWKASGS